MGVWLWKLGYNAKPPLLAHTNLRSNRTANTHITALIAQLKRTLFSCRSISSRPQVRAHKRARSHKHATWLPHKWKTNGSRSTGRIKSKRKKDNSWGRHRVNCELRRVSYGHFLISSVILIVCVLRGELAEVLEEEHNVNTRLLLEPGKTILPSASSEYVKVA